MQARAHVPLVLVWTIALVIFLAATWISRSLARPATVMPSYWVGLVGLLNQLLGLVTGLVGGLVP